MLPVSQRLLSDLVEKLIRDLPELEEVVLFGSHARGEDDPNVDVDLLLLVDADFQCPGAPKWEYVKKVRDAKSPFPMVVDFRVFSLAEADTFRLLPNHLVAVALGEGKVVYRRSRIQQVA